MIRLEGVDKDYRQRPGALASIDLRVADGELLVVEGPAGSGKSTLCRLLTGAERPTRGKVCIGDQDVARLSEKALPFLRQRIGHVFQDDRFIASATALENVILPLDIAGAARRDAIRRAKAALDRLGLLAREASRPDELSDGEQCRLAIARAIAHQPALLLADAPFGRLDAGDAAAVAQLFADFSAAGCTVLVTAREVPSALRHASDRTRIVRLDHGQLSR